MSTNFNNSMLKKTQELFKEIGAGNELSEFTLVGGTALAIHLEHRTSEDLDFFINRNKLNNDLIKKIDSLLERLGSKFNIRREQYDYKDDDVYRDYWIGDVKVTMFAAPLSFLRESEKKNNINVASIEQIAAMKMHVIMKNRIKSRDFYDVKYIMESQSLDFGQMIDLAHKYYGRLPFSENLIEARFLKIPLHPYDEGFSNLKLKKTETFDGLRRYFKENIRDISKNQKNIIDQPIKDITDPLSKKIGLVRNSILMEKYLRGDRKDILLLDHIDQEALDVINIYNQTIFDLVIEMEDLELLNRLLLHSNVMPNIAYTYGISDEIRDVLNHHRLLIRCLNKNNQEIENIIRNKNENITRFWSNLDQKRTLLLNIPIDKKVADFSNVDMKVKDKIIDLE